MTIATAKANYALLKAVGDYINRLNLIDIATPSDNLFSALALGIVKVKNPEVSIRNQGEGFEVEVDVGGEIDTGSVKKDLSDFEANRFLFLNALATQEQGKAFLLELDKLQLAYEAIEKSHGMPAMTQQVERIQSDRQRIVRRLAALMINERVIISMEAGKYADPVQTLKELYKAIAWDGENVWLYIHRGRVAGILLDTNAAVWDFDKAIEMNPYLPFSYYFRGRLFYDQKDFEEAVKDFNQSIALDTNFDLPLIYRGKANRKRNKHKLAIMDFTRAIQKNPKNHVGYVERGLVYFDSGAYQDAIKDYDAAVKLKPENARIYLYRGQAQLAAGSSEAGCDNFRTACRLGDCSGIRQITAEAKCNKNNARAAQEWNQKCYQNVLEKNWQDAIIAASLAISYQPGMIDPYINRAWAFAETGKLEEAIQDCDRALTMDPQRAEVYNNRGFAYHRKGNKTQATQDYLKACRMGLKIGCENYLEITTRIEPPKTEIDQLLSESANQFKQKKWHAVLQLTDRVLRIDPANFVAYANRSAAFSYMGRLTSAVAEADKAIVANSKFGLAYNNRGYALELMGKTIEAMVDYRLGCLYNSRIACDNYRRLEPTLR